MGMAKAVKVDDKEVVCRELRVMEIRDWIQTASKEDGGLDIVGELLFEDITLELISMITQLPEKDLEKFSPSDLQKIIAGCKEVNQDFFGMLKRAKEVGDRVREVVSIDQSAA